MSPHYLVKYNTRFLDQSYIAPLVWTLYASVSVLQILKVALRDKFWVISSTCIIKLLDFSGWVFGTQHTPVRHVDTVHAASVPRDAPACCVVLRGGVVVGRWTCD